jgi:hypothetical protein
MKNAALLDPVQFLLDPLDVTPNQPTVGLYLGFSGAAGADAATEALQMGPLAGQTGK